MSPLQDHRSLRSQSARSGVHCGHRRREPSRWEAASQRNGSAPGACCPWRTRSLPGAPSDRSRETRHRPALPTRPPASLAESTDFSRQLSSTHDRLYVRGRWPSSVRRVSGRRHPTYVNNPRRRSARTERDAPSPRERSSGHVYDWYCWRMHLTSDITQRRSLCPTTNNVVEPDTQACGGVPACPLAHPSTRAMWRPESERARQEPAPT